MILATHEVQGVVHYVASVNLNIENMPWVLICCGAQHAAWLPEIDRQATCIACLADRGVKVTLSYARIRLCTTPPIAQ